MPQFFFIQNMINNIVLNILEILNITQVDPVAQNS